MRRIFFILIGIISAGFAVYFFACSSVETFKIKVPRSANKIRSAMQVISLQQPVVHTVATGSFLVSGSSVITARIGTTF
jgi:hypothetical protein